MKAKSRVLNSNLRIIHSDLTGYNYIMLDDKCVGNFTRHGKFISLKMEASNSRPKLVLSFSKDIPDAEILDIVKVYV
jgi:hypothetical protein